MTHKLLIVALISTVSFASTAQKADFKKPIKIVAQKQETDLKNRIASYIGGVKISQGSLAIEADLVQVSNIKGTQQKKYLAKGKPAKFSQTLENGDKIELQANEISYSPTTSTVVIRGNAKVSQEGSMVQGETITYNLATETLTADGATDGKGVVTTIIEPDEIEQEKQPN
ncbi:lipopolysaccharide transport periplasmic protein LptA [Thalassotalea maritima]|uniref:lipopolysaccharide transport periplasmic protein LptA n=1 Tax=Thalassotalea maritima TaxID=3242416 RepID=UPI003528CBB7